MAMMMMMMMMMIVMFIMKISKVRGILYEWLQERLRGSLLVLDRLAF